MIGVMTKYKFKGIKRFKVLDNPCISLILLTLAGYFLPQIFQLLVTAVAYLIGGGDFVFASCDASSDLSSTMSTVQRALTPIGFIENISSICASLGILAWYWYHYRPHYDGVLIHQKWRTFIKGVLYSIPLLLIALFNLVGGSNLGYLSPGLIVFALVPAVLEEVTFRGLLVSNLLRVWNKKEKILPAVLIPAVIFGLMHGINIMAGANVDLTIVQILYAFAMGFLLGAIIARTGNILPGIIAHFLIDFFGLLAPAYYESSGIVTGSFKGFFSIDMIVVYVIVVICLIVGFVIIRWSKLDDIVELWADKFGDSIVAQTEDQTYVAKESLRSIDVDDAVLDKGTSDETMSGIAQPELFKDLQNRLDQTHIVYYDFHGNKHVHKRKSNKDEMWQGPIPQKYHVYYNEDDDDLYQKKHVFQNASIEFQVFTSKLIDSAIDELKSLKDTIMSN